MDATDGTLGTAESAAAGALATTPGVGDMVGGLLLEERIGAGGMGVVFRAYDASIDRTVAVKVLAAHAESHPDARLRLVNEATVAERVGHPNVLRVHSVGRTEAGATYVVMHHVPGPSLARLIEEVGPLPLDRVAGIVVQVAAALDAVHRAGLVHRDVKPANILWDPDSGTAFLADFGIAALRDGTGTGSPGTKGFMAPEQVAVGPIDGRADQFALARTAFVALTGADPGDHLTDHRLSDLPRGARTAILRAVAASPEDRFATAGEFAAALRGSRFDTVLLPGPANAGLARGLRARLCRLGVDVAPLTVDPVEAIRSASSCCIFLGGDGLAEWTVSPVDVARRQCEQDQPFDIVALFLRGEQGLDDPQLSRLPGACWMQLDPDLDDDDVSDLAHLVMPRRPISAPVTEPATCPYQGLEAFQEAQADVFFGREAEVSQLLERIRERRFLVVIGASGCGKSSLVRAGLVPALGRGRLRGSAAWPVFVFRPGGDPVAALADAVGTSRGGSGDAAAAELFSMAESRQRTIIVIDQFEEVFTQTQSPARESFLAAVADAATRPGGSVTVIVTLRADFFARCIADPSLSTLIGTNQHVVGAMGPAQLRRAIEEPARLRGVPVEPALVRRMIADVGGRPGALPLLSHQLRELFHRGGRRGLTLSAYGAAGGLDGSLARHAEAVLNALEPAAQTTARLLLTRLVEPGEDTEDTRRRATRAELDRGWDGLGDVIRAFTAGRLVTVGEDRGGQTFELSHEALIRGWPRLSHWLDESRDRLVMERRLGAATSEWLASGKDESTLLRGGRLAEWADRDQQGLSHDEREFLATSHALAQAEYAASVRRRRLAWVSAAAVMVLLAGAALVAISLQRETAHRNELLRVRALVAESSEALPRDPGVALASALDAVRIRRTPDALQSLRSGLAADPLMGSTRMGVRPITAMASPDHGATVFAADESGDVIRWETRNGAVRRVPVAGPVQDLAAIDSRRLAIARRGRPPVVVAVAEGAPTRVQELSGASPPPREYGSGQVSRISSNGRRVVSSRGRQVTVWDLSGATRPASVNLAASVTALRVLPSGRVVAGLNNGQVITLAPGLQRPRVLASMDTGVASLAVAGGWLAASSRGGEAVIGRVDTGRLRSLPSAASGPLTLAADGVMVRGDAPPGSAIRLSSPRTGRSFQTLPISDQASVLASLDDGYRVMSGHRDGTLRLWDLRVAGQAIDAFPSRPAWMVLSPDATKLGAIVGDSLGVEVHDALHGGRLAGPLRRRIRMANFGGQSSVLALGDADGAVRLLTASGELQEAGAHRSVVLDVAPDADGRRIVSVAVNGEVAVRTVRDGLTESVGLGQDLDEARVAFSTDRGRVVIAATPVGATQTTLWRWDLTERKPEELLILPRNLEVAIDPRGRSIVAGLGGNEDRVVRAALEPGGTVTTLAEGLDEPRAVSLNSGGNLVVVGGASGRVLVVAEDGAWKVELRGTRGPVRSVRFARDGGVVAARDDGSVWRWTCASCGTDDAVVRAAERLVGADRLVAERRSKGVRG